MYVDDEALMCTDVFEYAQVQTAGNSGSEESDANSDDAESLSSQSEGSCCGNLGDLNDAEFEALTGHTMLSDEYHRVENVGVEQDVSNNLDVILEESNDEPSSNECMEDVKPNVHDDTLESDGYSFDDTKIHEDVSEEKLFGIRGPKSTSILEPNDCYQLLRISRNMQAREQKGGVTLPLLLSGLKEEADFVPEEMFDVLVVFLLRSPSTFPYSAIGLGEDVGWLDRDPENFRCMC